MGLQFAPPPPAAVTRLLTRFDRYALEGFIAVAIDLLDMADGNADEEDDERSAVVIDDARDPDFGDQPISDDGLPGDPADAEPDPDEDDHDAEAGTLAESGTGIGMHAYVDGENEDDGWETRCEQRDRIRRTRCTRQRSGDYLLPRERPVIMLGTGRIL